MLRKSKKLIKTLAWNSIFVVLLVWLLLMIWLMLSATNVFALEPIKNPSVEETQLYGLNNDNWGESESAKSHPNDKIFYEKTQPLPNNKTGQNCVMKVIYYEKDDGGLVKEEILECADGRVAFDGPTYWQLFSEFYYSGVNVPKYCRKYNRPNHAFKSYGTVCLNKKGKWEVK
tara:strand:- start:29 stop:547 length:519 start_codon:yes stop_codon:yes gene_type:complete